MEAIKLDSCTLECRTKHFLEILANMLDLMFKKIGRQNTA